MGLCKLFALWKPARLKADSCDRSCVILSVKCWKCCSECKSDSWDAFTPGPNPNLLCSKSICVSPLVHSVFTLHHCKAFQPFSAFLVPLRRRLLCWSCFALWDSTDSESQVGAVQHARQDARLHYSLRANARWQRSDVSGCSTSRRCSSSWEDSCFVEPVSRCFQHGDWIFRFNAFFFFFRNPKNETPTLLNKTRAIVNSLRWVRVRLSRQLLCSHLSRRSETKGETPPRFRTTSPIDPGGKTPWESVLGETEAEEQQTVSFPFCSWEVLSDFFFKKSLLCILKWKHPFYDSCDSWTRHIVMTLPAQKWKRKKNQTIKGRLWSPNNPLLK